MPMGLGGLGRPQARINVTPLIDVLLVLLVIFIMAAPVSTRALRAQIPRRADPTVTVARADAQLVVRLSAAGSWTLNGAKVDASALSDRLREAFARREGERVVFLDAEAAVPYGTVIEAMDLCREGGAETIGAVPDSIGQARD